MVILVSSYVVESAVIGVHVLLRWDILAVIRETRANSYSRREDSWQRLSGDVDSGKGWTRKPSLRIRSTTACARCNLEQMFSLLPYDNVPTWYVTARTASHMRRRTRVRTCVRVGAYCDCPGSWTCC